MRTALLFPLCCTALLAQTAPANPVMERYTKQEVLIPMRDGVSLFTALYVPKQLSRPHPILLNRTPYGIDSYGPSKFPHRLGPSPLFLEEGYIVVYQDVRGRFMSEGTFEEARPVNPQKRGLDIDEGTDTYDTVEWLLKNVPNNNGKVGQWGISYDGHYTVQGMLSGHPALVAVSPQAPMIDMWEGDDGYHLGAFQLAANFSFFPHFKSVREKPTPASPRAEPLGAKDGYQWYLAQGSLANLERRYFKGTEPIWSDYVQHWTYDAYWQVRNLRPHIKAVKPAVLTVGGWFDQENVFGALATHRALAAQSPATQEWLVMGPWTHGQWASGDGSRIGTAVFGSNTAAWYQKEVELPFFNHFLKGEADPRLAKATVFVTGENQWRTFDAWPPRQTQPRTLYFQPKGGLSFQGPGPEGSFDEYVSDPAKPVPFTQEITIAHGWNYMTEDQRFAARRPDVLTYETAPLDADLTLAGPLKAALTVSTTGTDSDFIVKLVDVFSDDAPDPKDSPQGWHASGYQMLVRGNVMRGKFRKSFTTPVPFSPGAAEEVAFTLPDVLHTFKKGHRIMVQVQSSWFPLVDRNPQTFTDIPNAKPEEFRKATQRVFHNVKHPSRLEILVLE